MECPACRQPQLIVEVEGVELDLCHKGCGVWFDAQELSQLLGAAAPELERALQDLPTQGRGRRCPRCRKPMELILAPGGTAVMLDRCSRGHGLWFDQGELEQIVRAQPEDAALARVSDFLSQFFVARNQS